MATFLWPAEGGWPYPDTAREVPDPQAEMDDDIVALHAASGHLFDGLSEVERQVITAHYGLDGHAASSMKELHTELGLSRAELRDALGSGLGKLRARFG